MGRLSDAVRWWDGLGPVRVLVRPGRDAHDAGWYLGGATGGQPAHDGLRAAVKAIRRKGGGIVEGHATAIAPGPPPKAERNELYVDGDVLFWGGTARVRYGVEVDGVGPVAALYRGRRSMHGAALGGTVEMYRRETFEAIGVVPRPKSGLADRIVMRRQV